MLSTKDDKHFGAKLFPNKLLDFSGRVTPKTLQETHSPKFAGGVIFYRIEAGVILCLEMSCEYRNTKTTHYMNLNKSKPFFCPVSLLHHRIVYKKAAELKIENNVPDFFYKKAKDLKIGKGVPEFFTKRPQNWKNRPSFLYSGTPCHNSVSLKTLQLLGVLEKNFEGFLIILGMVDVFQFSGFSVSNSGTFLPTSVILPEICSCLVCGRGYLADA